MDGKTFIEELNNAQSIHVYVVRFDDIPGIRQPF